MLYLYVCVCVYIYIYCMYTVYKMRNSLSKVIGSNCEINCLRRNKNNLSWTSLPAINVRKREHSSVWLLWCAQLRSLAEGRQEAGCLGSCWDWALWFMGACSCQRPWLVERFISHTTKTEPMWRVSYKGCCHTEVFSASELSAGKLLSRLIHTLTHGLVCVCVWGGLN